MMLPVLNNVYYSKGMLSGYIGSDVIDSLRVFFSINSEGRIWWTVFMGSAIIADNLYPVT